MALYTFLLLGGWILGDALQDVIIPEMRPMHEPMIHRIVMSALILFILAAAIPFVPGAEIGFALLLVFGGKAAPLVYGGMVGALILSYCIARLVPADSLGNFLRWLGLTKAADLVFDIEETEAQDRAMFVARKLPKSFGEKLVRNRYILLAMAINLPGNTLLGGGGGLAFIAARSGLFGFWSFTLVVLCSVAPVPLLFALM
ncbi:hypothetical protein [uncultured Sneathiella sp.]|uniref:hypothetical protein n=2 Tax=uncultured Sneathiella sp. TaxID=879315 RepID=UPI0030DAB9D9